ncbi:MAG: ATP-binding protein [Candidatus Eisenbacteria bacterium]|nr:ATP-binding protein [Candidatus Eisenbacteria bacterium]
MTARNKAKTNPEVVHELRTLRHQLSNLKSKYSKHRSAEDQARELSRQLQERVKELNCLYSISRLSDRRDVSLNDLLQTIVELIPSAWQYPESTCARLVLQDRELRTKNFRKSKWKQSSDIFLQGKRAGTLEVYYVKAVPENEPAPFLEEERSLLDTISEHVERIIGYKQAEEQAERQREQLIQLDKMAALGTLVSGVAHEINNPNSFIMLNAPILAETWESIAPILEQYYREHGDFMMGGISYSEMREDIPILFSGILEGSQRIKKIVQSLKDFARAETPNLEQSVDINLVVKSALTLLNNLTRRSTKCFSVQYGKEIPPIKGDFHRLEQVVVNLVQNSCEALPDRHKGIYVSTEYEKNPRRVVVIVRDEGRGIPREHLPHIMDPFFTSKRQTGGTGLGLSVSAGIVKDHNGTLSFTSELGKETVATLILPVSSDQNSNNAAVR